MFSSNLEPLKIQKFSDPLAPTMVGPAGDTELSKSLHIFFANHFLILNWNPDAFVPMYICWYTLCMKVLYLIDCRFVDIYVATSWFGIAIWVVS